MNLKNTIRRDDKILMAITVECEICGVVLRPHGGALEWGDEGGIRHVRCGRPSVGLSESQQDMWEAEKAKLVEMLKQADNRDEWTENEFWTIKEIEPTEQCALCGEMMVEGDHVVNTMTTPGAHFATAEWMTVHAKCFEEDPQTTFLRDEMTGKPVE